MSRSILVVDDDVLYRTSLKITLEHAGYVVQTAASGEEGLSLIQQRAPDLILLDIGLPDIDGLQVIRQLEGQKIPVIFLTARRHKLDEVLGLELGAEDYITKPFEQDILLARIKTVMRRFETALVKVGDLTIDTAGHTVTMGGRSIDLPPREFALLHILASRAGQVVPLEELLVRAWGPEYAGEPQVVYVRVRVLREALEEDPNRPRRIVTVRGIGYKLVLQER